MHEDDGKGKEESLFGPSIGIVNSGPSWTALNEKKIVEDELTHDVVKVWVEKSKSGVQPTTTLQALVNLKRPTLRLSPLAPLDNVDATPSQQHGISFAYDCDSPQCGIYVYVMVPPTHPDSPLYKGEASPQHDPNAPLTKLLVYEQVTDGGFGKALTVEDGAIIELSRFLPSGKPLQTEPHLAGTGDFSTTTESPSDASTPAGEDTPGQQGHRTRRFTHFHLRRSIFHSNSDDRAQNRATSGPALAVVDTLDPSNQGARSAEDDASEVKLMIRLAALDEQGTEPSLPNEQVTFLSVARLGAKVQKKVEEPAEGAMGGASAANADESKSKPKADEDEEDTRPWVVRVVKREATIGPHTFQLHEIYGLASNSSKPAPAPTPAPVHGATATHTYPPVADEGTTAALEDGTEDCLLCLSSPREVVLMPCRHLVACKECAINMVEYGAGGTLNVSSSEPAATTGAGGEGEGENADGEQGAGVINDAAAPSTTTALPAPAEQRRRKRRAKGWFCPVCRQPYTSLLRISTSAPPPPADPSSAAAGSAPAHEEETQQTSTGSAMRNLLRPQFLRGFSRQASNANANAATAPAADVELGRV